jgi:hypothetical protein
MQEGDAGTKSLYIPPIRPLSEKKGPQLELLDSHSQKMHKGIATMKKLGNRDVTDLGEG